MECPNCQHENREGAVFCSECGTSFQHFCPQCGTEVKPTDKFCSECGTDLSSSQKTKTPSEPPRKDESDVHHMLRSLSKPGKVRGIEGLRAELIGRDDEFAKLKESLTEVLKGQGQMVSLIAEAGIGKSRLVTELKEYIGSESANGNHQTAMVWLEGRCLELGMTASYWPFIDIFHEYFAWSSEDNESARAQSIVSSLGDMVKRGDLTQERSSETGPLLGNLLSVRFGNEWDEKLKRASPKQIQRQTFMAVGEFFSAIAKREPVILVFEDLHWADSLSLDLISVLMESLEQGSLFLLCVYRPEKEHKCWDLANIARRKCPEGYTELVLRELTPKQSARLVESLLTIENLPSSMKELILNKSQGNPFFVEEVIRSLIDRELVYQEGEDWKAREEISDLDVPDMVQSLVLARVDRLEADSKNVLEYASVIGPLFKYRLLEHLVEKNGDLEGYLSELKERDLVYEERTVPEVEYAFKHVLTQEAIYQSIFVRSRRGYHKQVGEGIESLYGEQIEEHLEELAYHYSKSDDVRKGVEYLLKAGGKAMRSYANEEAITYLQKGLELLGALPEGDERDREELSLQIALGPVLMLSRGISAPELRRCYQRTQELAEQTGELTHLFHAIFGQWMQYVQHTDYQTTEELEAQLFELAGRSGDEGHLLEAHHSSWTTNFFRGNASEAVKHADQGIDLYRRESHHSHVALHGHDPGGCALIVSAQCLWLLGYPDQANQRSLKARVLAEELANPLTIIQSIWAMIFVHHYCGKHEEAEKWALELADFSKKVGVPVLIPISVGMQGLSMAREGRTEEGIRGIRRALDDMEKMFLAIRPLIFAWLLEACLASGKVEEGITAVLNEMKEYDLRGQRMLDPEIRRLYGELILLGNPAQVSEGEAEFEIALEVARRQEAKSLELRAAVSLSRLWEKQGKREEARELLGEIYAWFTEGFDTKDLKEAKELLDELS